MLMSGITSTAHIRATGLASTVRAGRWKTFSYQWGAYAGCGRNCRYISTAIAGLLPPPLSYLSIDFACLFPFNPAPHDKVRE
jgi:hypothetical protein